MLSTIKQNKKKPFAIIADFNKGFDVLGQPRKNLGEKPLRREVSTFLFVKGEILRRFCLINFHLISDLHLNLHLKSMTVEVDKLLQSYF